MNPVNATFNYQVFDEPIKRKFINRTGATLLKGHLAMQDVKNASTYGTTVDNASTSTLVNLTPATQTEFDLGQPVVAAAEDIANNAEGYCFIYGFCEIAVVDADVSTNDAVAGKHIGMVVSESAVGAQLVAAVTARSIGFAYEAAAADSANTDRYIDANTHRRKVFFTGGLPFNRKNA